MSLNLLQYRSYQAEIDALQGLLFRFKRQLSAASTVEEKALVEARLLTSLEQAKVLDRLDLVWAGQQPDVADEQQVTDQRDYAVRLVLARVKWLREQMLSYYATQATALAELQGRMRRVSQKLAQLKLWSPDEARFTLVESFRDLSSIAETTQGLEVVPAQGVALLPIQAKEKVSIKHIGIGKGSMGRAGNSDARVQNQNYHPDSLLNESSLDWFEWEVLDAGPARVVLVLELASEQIVNLIRIEPTVDCGGFKLENIECSSSTGFVTLDQLIGQINPDYRTIPAIGVDQYWCLHTLPVRTKQITVTLVQNQSQQVDVLTSSDKLVRRNRFGIGIRNIQLERCRYGAAGELLGSPQNLPLPLYGVLGLVVSYGGNDSLYSVQLSGKATSGQLLEQLTSQTALMSGLEQDFQLKLQVQRNPDAFRNLNALWDIKSTVRHESLLRSCSRFQSPAVIGLPEKAADLVQVIQPKLGRRGIKSEAVKIGVGNSLQTEFDIPFRIYRAETLDDFQVWVGGTEYTRVDGISEFNPANNEWCLSDDWQQILLGAAPATGVAVKLLLREEILVLSKQADGLHHRFKYLADPDRDRIRITCIGRKPITKTIVAPRGKRVFSLDAKVIDVDSVKVVSEGGVAWVAATDQADALAGPLKYWVDTANGIIYLSTAVQDDSVRITFDYSLVLEVPVDKFDVTYRGSMPDGIRIDQDQIEQFRYQETVGGTVGRFRNPRTFAFEARTDTLTESGTVKCLTYSGLVIGSVQVSQDLLGGALPEEVTFIDGRSEFIGLIPMEDERTIETTAGADTVTFTLQAGAGWYAGLGVRFSDVSVFATQVAAAVDVTVTGEYYVSPTTGLVTVWIGTGNTMPGDIQISYYYRDQEFDPTNKFSVDYERGYLHSYQAMTSAAVISYLAPLAIVAYDICERVRQTSYDKTTGIVKIKTELLHVFNNLIKIVWRVSAASQPTQELVDYYSPLIDTVALRFN